MTRAALRTSDWQTSGGSSDAQWNLLPGERSGPPLRRSRIARALRALVVGGVVAGGAWSWHTGQPDWQAWVPTDLAQMLPRIDLAALFTPPAPKVAEPRAEAPPPLTTQSLREAPAALPPAEAGTADRAPGEAARGSQTASQAAAVSPPQPPTTSSDANAPAPPGDPLRAKAEAAGLHPDLSRALLLKLSEVDYRNAALAVEKAMAAAADAAELIHPAKRQAGLAQFKIHFVEGAAERCRRYVVTIATDGWLTTALPMERCGVARKTEAPKGSG